MRVRTLSYFDVAAAAVAALVAADLFVERPPLGPRSGARLAACLVTLVAAWAAARRARFAPVWSSVLGAVAMGLAAAVVLWPGNLVHFVVVMVLAALALAAGVALRSIPVSERPPRGSIVRVASALALVTFMVGVLELAIPSASALFGDDIRDAVHDADVVVAHPYIGGLYRPYAAIPVHSAEVKAVHHVDSHGFRNTGSWPERADTVVVGDSFAFGWGMPDGQEWPSILARTGGEGRVMNLSLGGAAPQQYLRVYETFGAGLQPRLLLVAVVAQNDFWDAEAFDGWLNSGVGGSYYAWRDFGRPQLARFSVRRPFATIENVLRIQVEPAVKGSHLFRLFRVMHGGAEGGTAESPDWYTLPGGLRLQMSSAAALAGAAPTPARLALVVEALSRIRAMAAAHGTRTVVVLQPGKEETYRGLAGEPPVDMSASLRQALRQRAVEYLDLGPVFRKRAAAGAQLFFQTDAHPNAAGHALISECVGAYLSGRMPEDPEGQ